MHRHLGRWASFALVASLAIAACGTAPTTVTAIDQEPIPDSVPSVAASETSTTAVPTTAVPTTDGIDAPDSPELVFRFSTFSNVEFLAEPTDDLIPDPRSNFDVSLLADGTVVFVGGQIIFDGVDYHRTWKLSEAGFDRLLSAAVDTQIGADGSIGSNEYAVALEVDGLLLLDAHPSNGPLNADEEAALAQLVDLMFDQSWLEDEMVSGPEPWIADELSFAVSRNTQVGEPTPWPLDEPIRELLIETDNGTTALCLTGAQAAATWPLVQANGFTWFEVEDNRGERFTLSPFPGHPGYRVTSDPCWDRFAD